ncbi:TBC1 domain family member 4 isoform X5 [Saccopteryx bilineata]|uniref:TBC1 domain family member 4 isoform X5 n=1 Tax=Saccopteryx bilineata TaxID=59482 RepID=UPI00338E4848
MFVTMKKKIGKSSQDGLEQREKKSCGNWVRECCRRAGVLSQDLSRVAGLLSLARIWTVGAAFGRSLVATHVILVLHNQTARVECRSVKTLGKGQSFWSTYLIGHFVQKGEVVKFRYTFTTRGKSGRGIQSNGRDRNELLPLSPLAPTMEEEPLVIFMSGDDDPEKIEERKKSEELRSLWRKAIHQQILLLRMEKENQKLEASRDELHTRKVKLDYEEVGVCQKEVLITWDKKLLNCRAKIRCDMEDIHTSLKEGVPKSRRGEIWQFLALQYRLRHGLPNKQQPPNISYKELLKQLTAQQHAILVDLGRTFPTHPYFSAQLGAGQLSLFNLLKAYSLLDKEVGYCQGISFVAGVLLLHMSEEQAFEMLKFLMYDLGFRKQYRPDMMSLQIQMYQLSRLLHDYHRDLYNHLEENEISPSLYAAPWFLTLFASQFPLGFVARVFDIIFLQGTEVIFKVALSLLSSQEALIMECENFENIVEFLKSTLPDMNTSEMEKIITQVFEMDISKQLHAYEVEYHVLQDELQESSYTCEDSEPVEKLERANSQLKRQNMDLLEKLQAAHAKIQTLESNLENLLTRETKMKSLIRTLEQEKMAYQKTVEQIRKLLPADALANCEALLSDLNGSPNNKARTGSKP